MWSPAGQPRAQEEEEEKNRTYVVFPAPFLGHVRVGHSRKLSLHREKKMREDTDKFIDVGAGN